MVTILLEELVMQLFLWLLKLIDAILSVFEPLAGTTTVTVDGSETTLLEASLNNSTIQNWFWCILILCVGLLCLLTVAAVIKNMISNQKTNMQILGKFGLALLGMLAMLAVIILIVLISNEILQLVWEVVSDDGTGNVDLVNTLFNACVGEWYGDYSINQLDGASKITELTVSQIFGDYKTTAWVFPSEWKYDGIINPDEFYYVPAAFAVIGTAFNLLKVIYSMAKRIFEIVVLYLLMPAAMSTLPLDDGARFKNWMETFISKLIMVFGAVIGLRVYLILLQVACSITISSNNLVQSIYLATMTWAGASIIFGGADLVVQVFGNGQISQGGGMLGHMIVSGVTTVAHTAIHATSGVFHLGRKGVGQRSGQNDRVNEYGTGLVGVINKARGYKYSEHHSGSASNFDNTSTTDSGLINTTTNTTPNTATNTTSSGSESSDGTT